MAYDTSFLERMIDQALGRTQADLVIRNTRFLNVATTEIAEGDKRIVLVDGEVAGAINRLPGEGEIRSNLAVGGSGGGDPASGSYPAEMLVDWVRVF